MHYKYIARRHSWLKVQIWRNNLQPSERGVGLTNYEGIRWLWSLQKVIWNWMHRTYLSTHCKCNNTNMCLLRNTLYSFTLVGDKTIGQLMAMLMWFVPWQNQYVVHWVKLGSLNILLFWLLTKTWMKTIMICNVNLNYKTLNTTTTEQEETDKSWTCNMYWPVYRGGVSNCVVTDDVTALKSRAANLCTEQSPSICTVWHTLYLLTKTCSIALPTYCLNLNAQYNYNSMWLCKSMETFYSC